MRIIKKLYIIIFLISITNLSAYSIFNNQENVIDSLLNELSKTKDTNKVIILNKLSIKYRRFSKEKSKKYAIQAKELSQEINYLKGEAKSYKNLAILSYFSANYFETINYLESSLVILKKLKDSVEVSKAYNNLGIIYQEEGTYSKALKFYFKALELRKKLKNAFGIYKILNNIGNIYENQGLDEKALEIYMESVKELKKNENTEHLAQVYVNIATIYRKKEKFKKGLDYCQLSLINCKEVKTKIDVLLNMGDIYRQMSNYDSSLICFNKSLILSLDLNDKNSISASYHRLAKIFLRKGFLEKALNNAKNSYRLAKEINSKSSIAESSQILSKIYENLNNYNKAYEYLSSYIEYKDSSFNEDMRNQLESSEKNYEIQKKESENKELKNQELIKEKENTVLREQQKTQNYVILSIFIVLISVGILAFIMYKAKEKEKKAIILLKYQKKEIEKKNKSIREVNSLLLHKNDEITIQKDEIEKQHSEIRKKSEDIQGSIRYASRIQAAILPQKNKIKSLLPDSFILFRPRDIVSGDFYWMAEKDNKIIITAVDCTGHGVPGAFMSMISSTILNEIVNQKGITHTSKILENLHKGVNISLKQEETANQDGMDMAICVIDKEKNICYFSGAKNPLFYVEDGELKQLKGDRMPIGGMLSGKLKNKPFARYEIPLKDDTVFYIFSDGYQDQFGGKKGRKFMRRRFKNLLLEIHKEPMEVQKEILNTTIIEWMGEKEQIDDILIIGFKILQNF